MSREMRDFVTAFGIGASIGDRWQERARRDRIDQYSGADWTNPELAAFDRKYGRGGGMGGGMGGGRATAGAAGMRRPAIAGTPMPEVTPEGKRFTETYASGGVVPEGYVDDPNLSPEERRRRHQEALFPARREATPAPVSATQRFSGEYSEPNAVEGEYAADTGDYSPDPSSDPVAMMRTIRQRFPLVGQGGMSSGGDQIDRIAAETGKLPGDRGGGRPRATDVGETGGQPDVPPRDYTQERIAAETGRLPGDRGGGRPKQKAGPAGRPPTVQGETGGPPEPTPNEQVDQPQALDYEQSNALDPTKTGGVPRFGATAGAGSETGSPQGNGAKPPAAGGGSPNAPASSATGGRGTSATGGSGATTGGAGAGGQGKSARKGLKDQTRTAAFNPEDDEDMREADEVTRQAIKGGLQFAAKTFGLGTDQQGSQAFVTGVGAPDKQTMQAVDQTVARTVPDDYSGSLGRAKLQIRRMEIMYRWAVANGNTDRANKLAFEIMQYSAGTAAQYGAQAARAFQAGDHSTGQKELVTALDEIPDGYSVTSAPDGSIVYTDSKGREISRTRMTAEQMFNVAMGLSNRSMYWGILKERAGLVPSVQKGANADERSQLRAARLTTEGLRQQRLQQQINKGVGGGRGAATGGPSPVSDALADIRARMPARGGVPAKQPAPAAAPDSDGDGDGEDDDDGGAPPVSPGVNDETGRAPTPPASLMRVKPGTPDQVSPKAKVTPAPAPKFDPEGEGYDYETAKAAGLSAGPDGHWPSRDPRTGMLLKGRKHPTFQKGLEEDAKLGYTPSQKDGRYYTQKDPRALPPQVTAKSEFDEEHPLAQFNGRDPYADLLAGIDPKTGKQNPAITQYWATKQGRAERSNIIAEQRALNRDIKAWESRKKAFDKANTGGKAEGSKPRDVLTTNTLAGSTGDITTAIKQRMQTMEDDTGAAKPNTFNDGRSDPKELEDLTMDLVTSNKNLPTERALDHLGSFLDHGTGEDERDLRAFDVHGWADQGQTQVVISPRGRPDLKIKISKDGYGRLQRLVDKRFDAYQKKQTEDRDASEKRARVVKRVGQAVAPVDRPSIGSRVIGGIKELLPARQ